MAKSRRGRPSVAAEFQSTGPAAKALGICPDTLLKMRANLKRGTHWIDISGNGSKRACYRWRVNAILEYLGKN